MTWLFLHSVMPCIHDFFIFAEWYLDYKPTLSLPLASYAAGFFMYFVSPINAMRHDLSCMPPRPHNAIRNK